MASLRQQILKLTYTLTQIDPKLAWLFSHVSVDTVLSMKKTPFVALMGAIIGQRILYTKARQLRGALYRVMGGVDFSPQDVLDYTNLETAIPDTHKCAVMRRVAAHCVEHPEAFDDLDTLVTMIPGLGPWTRDVIKLVTFTDWDVFPCHDLFLRERVRWFYQLDHRPSVKETEKLVACWQPYRSVVALYMWRWF